jgi:hypothetical protein
MSIFVGTDLNAVIPEVFRDGTWSFPGTDVTKVEGKIVEKAVTKTLSVDVVNNIKQQLRRLETANKYWENPVASPWTKLAQDPKTKPRRPIIYNNAERGLVKAVEENAIRDFNLLLQDERYIQALKVPESREKVFAAICSNYSKTAYGEDALPSASYEFATRIFDLGIEADRMRDPESFRLVDADDAVEVNRPCITLLLKKKNSFPFIQYMLQHGAAQPAFTEEEVSSADFSNTAYAVSTVSNDILEELFQKVETRDYQSHYYDRRYEEEMELLNASILVNEKLKRNLMPTDLKWLELFIKVLGREIQLDLPNMEVTKAIVTYLSTHEVDFDDYSWIVFAAKNDKHKQALDVFQLLREHGSTYIGRCLTACVEQDYEIGVAQYGILRHLLEEQLCTPADVIEPLNYRGPYKPAGATALHIAAQKCHFDNIDALLDHGADVNVKLSDRGGGDTPVMLFVKNVDLDFKDPKNQSIRVRIVNTLKRLLLGYDMSIRNTAGQTVMYQLKHKYIQSTGPPVQWNYFNELVYDKSEYADIVALFPGYRGEGAGPADDADMGGALEEDSE